MALTRTTKKHNIGVNKYVIASNAIQNIQIYDLIFKDACCIWQEHFSADVYFTGRYTPPVGRHATQICQEKYINNGCAGRLWAVGKNADS